MQFLNSTALIEYLFSSKGNQILYTCTHVLYNLIFFVWTKTIQISQSSFRKIPQVFFFKIKRKVLTISLKPSWSKWLNQNIRNFFLSHFWIQPVKITNFALNFEIKSRVYRNKYSLDGNFHRDYIYTSMTHGIQEKYGRNV